MKSKIKVPADLILGEGSIPGLQTATFSLRPHMVVAGVGRRERQTDRQTDTQRALWSLLIKAGISS